MFIIKCKINLFVKNNQPKRPNNKQVDKTAKGSQVTQSCCTNADKKLQSIPKSCGASNSITTLQSVQPSKCLTGHSKSLSSYAEISLEDNSIKINSSGQQLAIKRPALKSESSLSTKKNNLTR